jgi:excisionase family DNA binding protein
MKENTFVSESWIGTKESTEHLGVIIKNVKYWIKSENIHCCRAGRLWKFKTSEVDAWVKSGDDEEDN